MYPVRMSSSSSNSSSTVLMCCLRSFFLHKSDLTEPADHPENNKTTNRVKNTVIRYASWLVTGMIRQIP